MFMPILAVIGIVISSFFGVEEIPGSLHDCEAFACMEYNIRLLLC